MKRMVFHKKLYIGSSVEKKQRYIKWKLYHHRHFMSLYVLILPLFNGGQLEIINANYLTQDFYKKNPPVIVGFAGSYEEATGLVVQLTERVFEETGTGNIKDYILKGE